eukprot:scaffold131562_cov29-Prasinocladus_malaysianus.AAC.1
MEKLSPKREAHETCPLYLRCVINMTYVAIVGAIAAVLPDAEPVLGLVGGVAITWMTFVLPSVMFLIAYNGADDEFWGTFVKAANHLIVVVFGLLGVLATAGAAYGFTYA